MTRVLFVCHGNICRSPMAEFMLKNMLEERGVAQDFYVESAATSREELGNDMHYGAKEALRKHGVPFARRSARQITAEDYRKFDYIICMDSMNVRNLNRIIGEDTLGKVSRLMSFAGKNADVADPWYTGDFDVTYRDIKEGLMGFIKNDIQKM